MDGLTRRRRGRMVGKAMGSLVSSGTSHRTGSAPGRARSRAVLVRRWARGSKVSGLMSLARAAAVLVGLALPVALMGACGARTGLDLFPGQPVETNDAGVDAPILDDVVLPGLDVHVPDVI